MEYLKLKNSELNVSRICMGGCPLGGYGWGETQEDELINAVHTAIECGVNFFDTADTYGLGQSEITLGKAIVNKRNSVIIASKFGVRVENGKTFYDNSPEWIEKALDASLKRLGTDYIDLYQVHYRDQVTSITTIVETLEKMKKAGKIRYYGLSNIYQEDVSELKEHIGKFVSFQDEYSLACRKNEGDMINISKELKMTPLTWGSLGQGILTGKYDKNVTFDSKDRRSRDIYVNFHGDKLIKNLEIVKKMRKIAEQNNKPISSIAIRFILDYLAESVVLCGVKRSAQIIENVSACDWKLNKKEINLLEEISR